MAEEKRHYYKSANGESLLDLKHKLNPIPEGYVEITEEEYHELVTPPEEENPQAESEEDSNA